MPEQVIFVNEHDEPIGAGTREEAWAKGIFVRIIRIIIRDENGRILSQHRVDTAKSYPGLWTNSASGHVDAGETWDEAAKRELQEEVGISTELKLVGDFSLSVDTDGKKIRQFNRFYEGVIDSSEKITPQPEEVSEFRWYELRELKQAIHSSPEMFTPGFQESITKFY
jgi:isopentenyl-diphosphate Delta-isomerase